MLLKAYIQLQSFIYLMRRKLTKETFAMNMQRCTA